MSVAEIVAVMAAGGIGAMARFGLSSIVPARVVARFPWATFFINVSGSLILGVATGLATAGILPESWRAIVGTGFLGGYTTFSTASVDALKLFRHKQRGRSIVYALGMFLCAVGAAAVGLAVGFSVVRL